MGIIRRQEITVHHKRGNPMSLDDVQKFLDEAREAGFSGGDTPWVGDVLIHGMSISRYEPS